ncbi:cilia- and flagella-associated protein HOATZ isoform X1 [Oncorhynchus keta]|uniref:cilia- and flagella-associated protein HOATZ isoform X1 n=2 Tax=Oncorhynchus keta TaxID=8018 RepID=UPI00227A1500|nr:cilia- and flagella-associated protein HOATZ isoform X1 [Oncorhynchus keta]
MFESEPRAGVTEEEERREAEQLETELDKYFFTVFDGSSPEDVSHAKQLWTSLSLLPPLESRLVNADIRQRLPIARTNQETLLVVGKTPMLLSNHLLRTIERGCRRFAIRSRDRRTGCRRFAIRSRDRKRDRDTWTWPDGERTSSTCYINRDRRGSRGKQSRSPTSLGRGTRVRGWLLTPQGTWTQTWRRSEGFSNTQTSASEQNQADPCLQELMF